MRVPGFDAGAFPTTGLGSLDSFIVRGFIDISIRGFPGFDVSASVLPGLASGPASARAGCRRILVAGSSIASSAAAAAASGQGHTGPGVGSGDRPDGDGAASSATRNPTLDCAFWDSAPTCRRGPSYQQDIQVGGWRCTISVPRRCTLMRRRTAADAIPRSSWCA